ncbi:protein translocase subunit SecDF [Mucilaginibacter rubeus]|uniref:Multifunctional fusion protein n=1 Tax=Mucilaginibacter rubeus TaxID=2027860 RepID=A0AAE6JCA5_9SPHI|nr:MULTISPECIES: protein translocase subunit SecDF [Mucilaginibacter]QEM02891.1 protein translocase subunit SecDF [Mucilaginibacter rubeus]QEM15510.1 protein translocase subunit SecDF [Mucilaginibacter gossypii]QTE41759.1 protein translocase subunit SecDF [Mucilaginibacter rubeus]QTE48363.1 protein translocase subunit SecDF [Mucilaginibacter rubeus]QTE59750.1 protein translocase subunit SecDF [Mucilaginibacter rubeus]
MQGKGVIKFFAILLAVVCLYQLSFTWVAHKVREDAKVYSKGDPEKEKAYLDSISNQPVYPLLKHDYAYVLQREIALGLDLKGGMNVTMQIQLDELVRKIANNNPDATFNQALANADKLQANAQTNQKDYIALFVSEYEKLNPNGKLAAIFSTKDNQDHLKFNASNSEVKTYLEDLASTAVKQSFTVLNTRINQFGVTQPNIQLQQGSNRILVELPGVKEPERVRKLLSGSAKLEFYETFDNAEAYQYLINIDNLLAAKSKTAKADTGKSAKADTTAKLAAGKADTAKGGSLLSKVQKNAAKNDTSAASLSKTKLAAQHPLFAVMSLNVGQGANGQQQLGQGPVVGYAPLQDTAKVNSYLHSADVLAVIPRNIKFLWEVKPVKNTKTFALYAIKLTGAENGPVLSGDVINDARADNDQKGSPEVVMIMNSEGAQKWRAVTAEASSGTNKKSIAIVLDDNVYSAPVVQNEISGGVSSISGNFTIDDTRDLANVLKAGRLPAPAHIVSESIVGPSLGEQAISAGITSSILGLVVVLIFMIAYYNRAGTVAVVAVIINIFFLMGVLTSLGAVLTVPGVAGIVLTLGIAVDANVLVYERVREELNLGKSLRIAVADGFKHALPSILDSQISTFLTGLILFVFGSGPIQGFATTLMIGIATSLFCSLLISRVIFEWMLDKGMDIKFSNPWSSHTFKNANFAFVKNRTKFYIFSGLFIAAGLVSIFTRGFTYGVDFEGGRNYIVSFPNKNVTTEQIHDAIDATLGRSTEVKTMGTDKFSITTNYLFNDNSTAADAKVRATLVSTLAAKAETKITDSNILGGSKVSATIADELKTSAIYTVLFAIFVISAYILIRFRKWQFSLGAMIATAHDALLVLSFFSLFNGYLPFSLDIDQAFIAAILTVIGYSINDTVVVFDRIREFLDHSNKNEKTEEVINRAINSTLSRTIITALTVVFVLLVLFIFGGDVIKGFSFALLIGVLFGTYSSICVATPVIVDFGKKDLK